MKTCNGCEPTTEESFALELLKGYKKQFAVVVTVLSVIIVFLLGIIIYDAYVDSLYDTFDYTQDGEGYNNINTGIQGDVANGTEVENTEEERRQSEGC